MNTPAINARTRLCAVIGNPVTHSLSPAIHNAAFAACGLDWIYTAFTVRDLPHAIAGVRALGIAGLSITIPHKVAATALVDRIDDTAQMIGSINTVVNRDGILWGYNTDGSGALQALTDAGQTPRARTVLMIGSGGAARAVACTICREAPPAALVLACADQTEGRQLAADIERQTSVVAEVTDTDAARMAACMYNADIIINASPVGMTPASDACPVPVEALSSRHTVFDIVYTPLKTNLLRHARTAGATTIYGTEMFLNQALQQFTLWTGIPAPAATMRTVLMQHLQPEKHA